MGKSQLLAAITNAAPFIADYPYSTLKPVPGMARYENVWIQFVDIPPLLWEVTDPWVGNLLRNADALCLVVELTDDPLGQIEILLEELSRKRIRPLKIDEPVERQPGIYPKRVLIVGTKLELEPSKGGYTELCSRFDRIYPVIGVSAQKGIGLDQLCRGAFHVLDRVRVYTKSPGKKPDLTSPFIIRKGSTIMDLAEEIHKDFVHRFKAARIYSLDMYDGQRVAKDFVLRDGDIIELLV